MTSSLGPNGPTILPALTSVRIFLALGVVLFHLQLTWAWPTAAYTGVIERARLGVDVFFILSGFVLAHVYSQDVETGRYSHWRFLVARLARVYPAHLAILLMMVVIALTAIAMGEAFDPASYSMSGLARTVLLVHAWTPTATPVEWNGPSWSLSAEWGAYLLFPLFAVGGLALRRWPLVLLALSGLAFVGLDAGYRRLFDDALLHAEFNLGVLRILPTFLAGVALLHLFRRLTLGPRAATAAAVVGAPIMLALMHFRAPEPLVVASAAALILALALLSKSGADGPLAWPVLIFLGEASYAIYLLHLPLLVLWKNAHGVLLGGDSNYVMPMGEAAAFLVTAVAGGAVLHAFFEKPMRLWVRARLLKPTPTAAK